MFKKITLVMVSVFMFSTGNAAMAGDDLIEELANTKIENISDADIEVEDFELDVDVDQLSEDTDGEDVDALEACFRRFGYRSWGYGYRHYGYRCFRPVYRSYSYYRPLLCRPVYNYCAPVVTHYWGCH